MQFGRFLTDSNSGRQFRLNGVVPSNRLPNHPKLRQNFSDHMLFGAAQLPDSVDLRSDMTAVENQSTLGSCVANAFAGAYEYLLKQATGQQIDVSRLFIYYNARTKDDQSDGNITDSGCSLTSAIEALYEFGTCLESLWPYDISAVNTRPPQEAFQQATDHQITSALKVNIDLNEMKTCLAQGFPFAFGVKLFESFNDAAKSGVVPEPGPTDQTRGSNGSHAMVAVGYSDEDNAFIVRNSWGTDWGQDGYCYMSYDYMTNSDYCFEPWTIRKLETDDMNNQDGNGGDYDDNSYNYQNQPDNNSVPYQNEYNNNFVPDQYGYDNNVAPNQYGYDDNVAPNQYGYDDNVAPNQYGYDDNVAPNQYAYGNDSGLNQFGNNDNFPYDQYGSGNNYQFDQYGSGDGNFY